MLKANGKPAGAPGAQLMVGFKGLTIDQELRFIIREFRVGGIVLFRRNVAGVEQLQDLLQSAQALARQVLGRELLVAVDQEGGPVQRLIPPFAQLPSARDAASQGPAGVRHWAGIAAQDLRRIGVHINLAPVLDVVPQGFDHFMQERSLGSEPRRVAELGCLWVQTLQEQGISATVKHFPGLGRARQDPHHYAPVIQWPDVHTMETDVLPFREAIEAGAHCVMTSHALYPDLDPHWPATLSPAINRSWLRERLQFDGVVLSDDLDMAAVCERYSRDTMVRQGLHSTIDFFLLCQASENIEPFYRALDTAIGREQELLELHRISLGRVQRLHRLHGLHSEVVP